MAKGCDIVVIIVVGVIVALVFFGFLVIIFVPWILGPQSWAKKEAKKMLDSGTVDWSKVDRVLKILSTTQDHEGKRLYYKLANLADAQR